MTAVQPPGRDDWPTEWGGPAAVRLRGGIRGGARLGLYLGLLFAVITAVLAGNTVSSVGIGAAVFIASVIAGGALAIGRPLLRNGSDATLLGALCFLPFLLGVRVATRGWAAWTVGELGASTVIALVVGWIGGTIFWRGWYRR